MHDNPQSMNGWTENKKLVLHRQEEVEHDMQMKLVMQVQGLACLIMLGQSVRSQVCVH